MEKHDIVYAPIGSLRANPKNVRTHSKRQIRQIADSIIQFGFLAPIVVDEGNCILAGHGRWLAAKQLDLKTVPVVMASGLTEAQRRAYALADNKLAEKAGWDFPALAVELSALSPLLGEAGLNIELTGFDPAEIDTLVGNYIDREDDPADARVKIETEAVSKRGDIWLLGRHRIGCGDARDPADVGRLMAADIAAMVITDPPYNVPVSTVQGRGKIKHRNFVAAAGEMSEQEFGQFLVASLSLAAEHSADGAIHFVFMDWRRLPEMLSAGKKAYSEEPGRVGEDERRTRVVLSFAIRARFRVSSTGRRHTRTTSVSAKTVGIGRTFGSTRASTAFARVASTT